MTSFALKYSGRNILSKSSLWTGALVFCFLISFRALIISHFYSLIANIELLTILLLGIFMVTWIFLKTQSTTTRIGFFDLLVIALTLLPVQGAIAARIEFGQPIILGLVAYKEFFLIYMALFVSFLLHNKIVGITQVKRALLIASWISLIYFYAMSLFTDPRAYQDSLLAGAQQSKGTGVYYRFSMAFMFFGTIYYWVKSWLEQKPVYLIAAALFLAYIVFFRMDRTSMAFVIFAMLLFLIVKIPIKRIAAWLMIAVLPALSLLFIIAITSPSSIMNYIEMFTNAIGTIRGTEIQDGASILRQYEWDIASKYVSKNPFMGNGKLTGEWVEGGFDYFFGFFYPGDVGFLGQLFMYGIIGTLLLYTQFLIAVLRIQSIKHLKKNVFFVAVSFYLLVLFLDSLSNGSLTTYAAQTLIIIAIIEFYAKSERHLQRGLAKHLKA